MRKILLITAATSSFLMAADQYKEAPDKTRQAAWAATRSHHAPVYDKNGGVWINGAYYTQKGLKELEAIANAAPVQHTSRCPNPYFLSQASRAPLTPPAPSKPMPPEETPRERLEKACGAMGVALPQDVKVKTERPIQALEVDAAGSNLSEKVWAHIMLGYARLLTPIQAKKYFLDAIGLCSKRRELAFEWKVATIGLINALFETGEVLRALFLLHKFDSAGKSMVESKREQILDALAEGWEDTLRETEWLKNMDSGYPDTTIKKIKDAVKFFRKELYPVGKM